MKNDSNRLNKKNRKSFIRVIVVLCVLFLLLYLLFRFLRGNNEVKTIENPIQSGIDTALSVTTPDIVKDTIDTVHIDSVKRTVPVVRKKKTIEKTDTLKVDTLSKAAPVDTAADSTKTDTLVSEIKPNPCDEDTTELWVYPDPSGGLHRRSINVKLFSNKQCTIYWKFKKDNTWSIYNEVPLSIDSNATLVFKAIDSCGKEMGIREEYYQIEKNRSTLYCPSDMEYIKIGSLEFCIDRYEWPNRKGVVPQSYISVYHAMDSCYSAGKRLCSADEWTMACSGPYSWPYPYGQKYEHYACATADTTVAISGSKPECRGFFDVYDMSGNLAEWTSTRAQENRNFYYVEGGFYQSGPKSGCFDKRYSYFPQNKHNPVGFRCCKDSDKSGTK
jgi:hypothetical protein